MAYRIDGSGDSVESANRSLGSTRGNLVKKLEAGNVSTELTVEKSVFAAEYSLKGKCTNVACVTSFKVESTKSWDVLLAVAGAKAGDISRYNGRFTVEQYLGLTQEQEKALKSPRAPAGIEPRPVSYLEKIRM